MRPQCVAAHLLLFALLASATAANAQPPAPIPGIDVRMQYLREEVPILLQSADPREQAWGAWLAGQHGMREMLPLLELVLRNHVTSNAEAWPVDFAVDALIQLDAALSPDLLEQLAEHRPVQALVLVSGSNTAADHVLLTMLSRERGLPWFAAANLLLVRKPQSLAAKLLEGVSIEAMLTVSDDGLLDVGVGGSAMGIGCGVVAALAPGMPPWPSYALTPSARSGAIVLAHGPRPIYFERRVSRAGDGPSRGSWFYDGPTSADRLQYVAALADLGSMPVSAREQRRVKSDAQLDIPREISVLRSDIEQRYALFLQTLVIEGFLNNSEAAALPLHLEIAVNDLRTQRAVAVDR